MSSLKNLEDLFEHQLKDIYSAEKQIKSAIPKMIKNAESKKLKQALNDHLRETETQIERLNNIGDDLDITLTGETCKGMKGLITEAEDFMKEEAESKVRDAGLIANAQRVEHYEIAAYGTVVEYAKALGHREAARLLEQSLEEERTADEKLTDLAVEMMNMKARV
ncbi:ferritin-like domain-containing protein [Fodinibius sp. Rm-B-1B1-1]|uniref:ferritin-like domain-containing protein n=1 Tax=Fodinibius alkaliphilus TaxID=3140241 RepID=UPI00315B2878